MSTDQTQIKYFKAYIKAHKWSTFFFIFFGAFWAFTLPYMSYLFGEIINQIKTHGLESTPIYQLILTPLTLYIVMHIMRSIGYFGNGLFSLSSVPAFKERMIKTLFTHLSGQSVNYFETKQTGFVTNKISNINTALEPIIYHFFMSIYPQSLAILITGIMLSIVVPFYGLVLWVWGIAIIAYTYKSAQTGQTKSTAYADSLSVLNGYIVDIFNNIHSVIYSAAFKKESRLLNNYIKPQFWITAHKLP